MKNTQLTSYLVVKGGKLSLQDQEEVKYFSLAILFNIAVKVPVTKPGKKNC